MASPAEVPVQTLSSVADVGGTPPDVRQQIARSSAEAETATTALREALRELHRSDDEAWRRYAWAMEDASRRFDVSVALAAGRLRAERAASREDLDGAIGDLLARWHTLADELRVRGRLGQMGARDLAGATADELDRASRGLAAVLGHLRGEVGSSLTSMRREVASAFDDAAQIVRRMGTHS